MPISLAEALVPLSFAFKHDVTEWNFFPLFLILRTYLGGNTAPSPSSLSRNSIQRLGDLMVSTDRGVRASIPEYRVGFDLALQIFVLGNLSRLSGLTVFLGVGTRTVEELERVSRVIFFLGAIGVKERGFERS